MLISYVKLDHTLYQIKYGSYNYTLHISSLCTAEGEEAPPPGGWTDVQDADLPTAYAQQVADIVSMFY